jgi:pyruvate/2-oxoglutarate dehydrogenase complex dihydrolipoamide acyltransferase (E2) component
MPAIRVPQLGEGLREVRIVELLRRPGDVLRRGDTLYVVETDKSTVELESPDDGLLLEWRAAPGDIVPIGSTVAVVEPVSAATSPEPPSSRRVVPPRTRAYAKAKGLSVDALETIPSASGGKLLPADVDAYLTRTDGAGGDGHHDYSLGAVQRALVYRLRRSAAVVIPGSIAIEIPESWLVRVGAEESRTRPTPFQVFGHAVAQIAAQHPRFRSVMVSDDRVREYARVNVGLALARPDDELITAVVRGADGLSLLEFVRACAQQMKIALRQGDQATGDMQILLTHLGEFGIVDAAPTLVAPASSVFFLGAPRTGTGVVRIVLTFDHRLINGAAAAAFLVAVSDFLRAR